GCIFIEQTEIIEPPSFVVDAGDDIELTLGDTVQLDANATNAQGEVTFIWSAPYFGTLSCNECPDPTVNSQNTISYELYGVDSLGCEATDRLTVFIQKPRVVVVPTGFTPNDDRVNDRLLVHGLAGTQITKFQVFNRWGELVYEDGGFEVNTETVGWDGTFRDEPATSGVYLWYIEALYIDGNTEIFRGQTTLIR
ncbi:MAG: gliding motility-associated C-terminal domain-containing protein, partial [Bacteroidota bacterium]